MDELVVRIVLILAFNSALALRKILETEEVVFDHAFLLVFGPVLLRHCLELDGRRREIEDLAKRTMLLIEDGLTRRDLANIDQFKDIESEAVDEGCAIELEHDKRVLKRDLEDLIQIPEELYEAHAGKGSQLARWLVAEDVLLLLRRLELLLMVLDLDLWLGFGHRRLRGLVIWDEVHVLGRREIRFPTSNAETRVEVASLVVLKSVRG